MNNNTEKYELQLLYISQVASIIFIIISLIAIFLTHHDIKVLKHEKTLKNSQYLYCERKPPTTWPLDIEKLLYIKSLKNSINLKIWN